MAESSSAEQAQGVQEVGEERRVRPIMKAGNELVGYQCLTCKGERTTSRPGFAGATERIRCEPCNGLGYTPRAE